ncbi:MAG: ribose-phosphate pyrophosphokinase [Ignavibacteriales bacterium]|nr:ribose-phosphate pyrophosphokinase [Ignavibacteriales bacterium]
MSELKLFSGRSNPNFAEKVSDVIGIPLGKVEIQNFSDGEIWVKYNENIRGTNVFIVQSTNPPAENLIELLVLIDAAKRASARRITAVIPYFGYARQDRKDQPRVSITAKLIANLVTTAGADRVITMDLHAPQIQGFFDIPVDHLYSSAVYTSFFAKNNIPDLTVVSPDVGGIKMARAFARRLNAELVLIDKRRPKPNEVEVMNVIGNVNNRNILIVDDLIDTAGTFCNAVKALRNAGAKKIYGACTHPLFSGGAIERIKASDVEMIYVTDSIPLHNAASKFDKIEILSVTDLFGEAIKRGFSNQSISSLFDVDKG